MGKSDKRWGGNSGENPYYCGEQFVPIAVEFFYPKLTEGFSLLERSLLAGITRKAWEDRSLIVRASYSYLVEASVGLKTSSVKKYLATLGARGFVRLHRKDQSSQGNWLFVEPAYIWSKFWPEMEHIEKSRLARLVAKRLSEGTWDGGWLPDDQLLVAGQPTRAVSVGTRLVAGRLQSRSRSFRSNADPDSWLPEVPPAKVSGKEKEEGGPTGQDQNPQERDEGVGLTADDMRRSYTDEVRSLGRALLDRTITQTQFEVRMTELNDLHAKGTFFKDPSQIEKKEIVGGGVGSNSHAQGNFESRSC